MRVVCPTCDAAYEVPESVVTARRRMRCARCAVEFVAVDADHQQAGPPPPSIRKPLAWLEPDPEPEPEPDFEPEAGPALAPADLRIDETERLLPTEGHEQVSRARIAAILASWVLSLALLAAFGWVVIAWRQKIMQAWPASTRFYAALGYLK